MSKKILVADDSVVIQKSIGITFAQEDFQVTFVGNGEEAFQRASDVKPDLILADTSMPKLSGADLCKKFRLTPEFRRVPILLLASAQENFSAGQLKSFGADDYIQKPFESGLLLQKVKTLMQPAGQAAPAMSMEQSLDNTFGKQEADSDDETMAAYVAPKDSKAIDLIPSNDDLNDTMTLQEYPDPSRAAETVASMKEPSFEPAPEFDLEKTGDFPPYQEEDTQIVRDGASFMAAATQQPAPSTRAPAPQHSPQQSSAPQMAPAAAPNFELSEQQIEQIVSKVFKTVIERIAWEVVPEMAERIIKEEIEKITTEK